MNGKVIPEILKTIRENDFVSAKISLYSNDRTHIKNRLGRRRKKMPFPSKFDKTDPNI